jgi:uracil-DNA glycosylase
VTHDIYQYVKLEQRSQFANASSTALLDMPLSALEGLSAEHQRHLQNLGITRVQQLAIPKNIAALKQLQISPGLLHFLLCLVFYPQHDPGPDCNWEQLFRSAPLNYYASFAGSPFHTHFGPIFYRGRLNGSARVLVLGQDPATDETLALRAFVGQAGQLVQSFLTKLGLTRSYLMFNTFLFGVQSASLNTAMATDATIMGFRNQLLDHAKATNTLAAILAFGSYANTSATNWPGRGSIPIVHLMHPTSPGDVAGDWNSHFAAAQALIAPDPDGVVDTSPFTAPIAATDIPRCDLPFGLPSWHGTGGGTRSQRGGGASFETQIIWTAP